MCNVCRSCQKSYVIHKATRLPADKSFGGWIWDCAGLRSEYRETYSDKAVAETVAAMLTAYSGEDYEVSEAHYV